MKYILAPYVRIGIDNDGMYFGFGSIQKVIKNKEFAEIILNSANFFINPHTFDELKEYLTVECNVSIEDYSKVEKILSEGHYLIGENTYDREDRYSRHSLYYSLYDNDATGVQEKLKNKHVAILGCGGIGNQVSISLATAGVGKLTLIDFDIIEKSNLTRQIMFTEADVGDYKCKVLKRELLKRNSEIIIDTVHLKITGDKFIIPKCDLAVVSADSFGLVDDFNKYAIDNNLPYLNVGYIQDVAVWGPFVIPKKTGCMACNNIISTRKSNYDPHQWERIKNINMRSQAPSIGAINMLSSAHATLDILRFLGEYGEIASLNKRIGIWTDNLRIEIQECNRNPKCAICGDIIEE